MKFIEKNKFIEAIIDKVVEISPIYISNLIF